jgi:hypothetical protein
MTKGRTKENDSFQNLFGPPQAVKTEKQKEDTSKVQKIEKIVNKKPLSGIIFNVFKLRHYYIYIYFKSF